MTQTELIGKIKAEIERRLEDYSVQTVAGAELSDLLSFIESMEQSIDGNKMIGLDEAAKSHPDHNTYYEEHQETFVEGFKAGAKWMAEQGVTTETTIDEFSPELYNICVDAGLCTEDKAIVQIRKK